MKSLLILVVCFSTFAANAGCTLKFYGDSDFAPVVEERVSVLGYSLTDDENADLSLDVGTAHEPDVGLYAYGIVFAVPNNYLSELFVGQTKLNESELELKMLALEEAMKSVPVCAKSE